MFLICKLMTLLFGRRYVLLIHYSGHQQVSRATREGVGWTWRAMPSGRLHQPHTSCLLLQNGQIGDSYYIKEWLPITDSMWFVYSEPLTINKITLGH